MKKVSLLIVFVLLASMLSGCSTAPKELTEVTVCLDWVPNTNHTGMYVAIEKGYYKDAGLDVKLVQPPEDGSLALLGFGRVDFAVTTQEDIGAAITAATPLPVTAVAALLQHNTSGIISLADRNIANPKEMEGHTYATWGMPIEQAMLDWSLKKYEGDLNNVNMVESTVTDVISALQSDIDCVWIYYGWDGVAAKLKGLDTNFFYFKDIDPLFDNYTPVLAGNTDKLKESPGLAKKFLEATAKGYEYAIENPEDSANILCAAAPEIDKEIAVESQKYLAGQYKAEAKRWGFIDITRWDGFYNWLYVAEVIKDPIPGGAGFTNEYLPEQKN